MILRTDAIVLRTHRMTGTSTVAVLYTKTHGKVKAAAKGARRPRSRFGASLEPFTEGTYVIYYKEGREIQTMSEGDILCAFEGVKADLDRLIHASAIVELADHLAVGEEPNPALYGALHGALSYLERLPADCAEAAFWSFETGAAEALGYRPSFDRCAACGKPWRRGKAAFDPGAGGLVCSDCAGGGTVLLREETIRLLTRLQASEAEPVAGVEIPSEVRAEARQSLRLFVEYHTEDRRPLRSLHFKDQVTMGNAT